MCCASVCSLMIFDCPSAVHLLSICCPSVVHVVVLRNVDLSRACVCTVSHSRSAHLPSISQSGKKMSHRHATNVQTRDAQPDHPAMGLIVSHCVGPYAPRWSVGQIRLRVGRSKLRCQVLLSLQRGGLPPCLSGLPPTCCTHSGSLCDHEGFNGQTSCSPWGQAPGL